MTASGVSASGAVRIPLRHRAASEPARTFPSPIDEAAMTHTWPRSAPPSGTLSRSALLDRYHHTRPRNRVRAPGAHQR